MGAYVQRHHYVRAELQLRLHALFGRECHLFTAALGAEHDFVAANLAIGRVFTYQREQLKPARVGQYRLIPPGEAVQPAQRLYKPRAGAVVQVVRVHDHAGGFDRGHAGGAHRAIRRIWKERRQRDLAVRRN